MTIYEALNAVMKDVGAVAKAQRNQVQNFNFRGIDAVVNAVSPALREHGVIVAPELRSIETRQVEVGAKRSLMEHVTVHVTYTFWAPDGSSLACSVAGAAMDSGDKATPKAMSVAMRTALLQALCLPTDDPEPDAETYVRAPRPTPTVHADAVPAQRDAPTPASEAQRKRMHALLGELGITERGKYLALASWSVGRPLGSTSEMSGHETARFIDYLAQRKGGEGSV